jgi:putative polyhydroxyalkanoate system protein
MSTISIARKHAFTHKKAREVAEKIAQDLQKRFALDYAWKGDEVEFRRPGCSGRLAVEQDRFALDVNLNFLLTPLRPAIEREIVAQLDQLVGSGKADPPDGPNVSGKKEKPAAARVARKSGSTGD